jgi:hypothetical protein
MSDNEVLETTVLETADLRHSPQQPRSMTRLQAIEAAAREAIATRGRDRFTTADVADLAGCSIGTIYRYFPDRVAILDRLLPNRDVGSGFPLPVAGHCPSCFSPALVVANPFAELVCTNTECADPFAAAELLSIREER